MRKEGQGRRERRVKKGKKNFVCRYVCEEDRRTDRQVRDDQSSIKKTEVFAWNAPHFLTFPFHEMLLLLCVGGWCFFLSFLCVVVIIIKTVLCFLDYGRLRMNFVSFCFVLILDLLFSF